MKPRFKVLQLQPDYNVKLNDFADLGEQIVKALPTERFEVTSAFLSGRPQPGQPLSVADHSKYFEFPEKALKGIRLGAMWEIYKYCREQKFDVVICNRFKSVNMMLSLNRWLKIPLCIGISHGFGEYERAYRRRQTRRLVSPAWRFVGVSAAVRDYLIGLNCGFTRENTTFVTNAIDIPQAEALQLPREQARQALGLPLDARIIGALGRLVPIKGHTHLLQAYTPMPRSASSVPAVPKQTCVRTSSAWASPAARTCWAFAKTVSSMCAPSISGPCLPCLKAWAWRCWKA